MIQWSIFRCKNKWPLFFSYICKDLNRHHTLSLSHGALICRQTYHISIHSTTMRFVVPSALLATHLNGIGRVIAQKNNMPIRDCFKFDISGLQMHITASDNDTTLHTRLELVECDQDISFAINAKTLQDAIKEIPEQPLEVFINTENLEVTIVYQNGQYRLMAQDATEYPVLVVDDSEYVDLQIEANQLYAALGRGLVAAANDVLRPQLNAVCFDLREEAVSIVASNGSHLALTKLPTPGVSQTGCFILNTRPAGLLRSLLAKESGVVQVRFRPRGATFNSANYSMTCPLVEGHYPNYRAIIPTSAPNVITVNRLAIISALRRVLVFSTPATVVVRLCVEQGSLKLTTQDMDYNKSAEESVLCDYQGMPMRIAFKGNTLLELLQNIESEEVKIQTIDNSRAGTIVPEEQKEDEQVLMLIMPSVFND